MLWEECMTDNQVSEEQKAILVLNLRITAMESLLLKNKLVTQEDLIKEIETISNTAMSQLEQSYK